MVRKSRRKTSRPRTRRTTGARRTKPVRRAASVAASGRRVRAAIEEVRRAPLQPELPVDPDAPLAALDADALEVLNDTQDLEPDQSDRGIVGESPIDRKRATVLAGGDVDAVSEEVDVGEEAVGGSTPTPDQDVVDDLGRAAGVTYSDTEPLRPEEKIGRRDESRWEMDPASAEDYPERERARRRPRKTRP